MNRAVVAFMAICACGFAASYAGFPAIATALIALAVGAWVTAIVAWFAGLRLRLVRRRGSDQ